MFLKILIAYYFHILCKYSKALTFNHLFIFQFTKGLLKPKFLLNFKYNLELFHIKFFSNILNHQELITIIYNNQENRLKLLIQQ